VRHLAAREGWRYQQVQAIIVAIDQHAEAATGNREFAVAVRGSRDEKTVTRRIAERAYRRSLFDRDRDPRSVGTI
jgi:hypothetical protein